MTTQDFIIALFYAVDQERRDVPKRPDAKLYPSEVVTLALLFAITGERLRTFSRWLMRAYLLLFLHLSECTRLARLSRPTRRGPHAFWRRLPWCAAPIARGAS